MENARKEFEELEKRPAPQRASTAKPTEARLPAKLLISASKKQLEQAGAGKLSFEEFKKGVTVDELNFSKPNAASSSSGAAN